MIVDYDDSVGEVWALGILWIDDNLDRHYLQIPKEHWEQKAAVAYWLKNHNVFAALPKWVFYEVDGRQQLYHPADQLGLNVTELRHHLKNESEEPIPHLCPNGRLQWSECYGGESG